MRRRVFLAGSLLAGAAAAGAAWRERLRFLEGGPRSAGAAPLPDGRWLVRDAALAFGTTVSAAAVHGDRGAAAAALRDALGEIRRVDALMTVYRPGSEVSRLNAEGALDRPDPRLVRVLEFSQRLSELSGGAFDVTVQPLWILFSACGRERRLPTRDELARARALVGFRGLEVSRRRIALARPGMAVTLNGVAQGYAADLATTLLRERGVHDVLVDAGEWGADGARADGGPWTVGIQHPRDPARVVGAVAMDGRFLATSGDYELSFSEDRLYHHVFDPHTGVSPTHLSSVAVAARTGLEADGLTKPMMVLPLDRARALLARFPGAGAVWIDKEGRLAGRENVLLGQADGGAAS